MKKESLFNLRLVYESSIDGHRLDYIKYLVQYVHNNDSLRQTILFCIPGNAEEHLKEFLKEVKFHFICLKFLAEIQNMNKVKRSKLEWTYLKEEILNKEKYTHITFLNLDRFQYLVGSSDFSKFNLTASGILFQPYTRVHIPSNNSPLKFKSLIRKKRKQLQTRWMLKNVNLSKVFILNDLSSVGQLNKLSTRKPFIYLPDPISENSITSSSMNIHQKYDIDEKREIALLFGVLNEKKNILNILKSIAQIDEKVQSMLVLLIIGKVTDTIYKDKINEAITSLKQKYPSVNVVFVNSYVSDEERDSAFRHSKVILMPYVNFYSSSGVLGHAAKFGKPVIASNTGLIQELVEYYELGTTVDPYSTESIAKQIIYYLKNKSVPSVNSKKFVKTHSSIAFAKTLLEQ